MPLILKAFTPNKQPPMCWLVCPPSIGMFALEVLGVCPSSVSKSPSSVIDILLTSVFFRRIGG